MTHKPEGKSISEFTTLIDGLSFAECPRWHAGRLYVSDFYTNRVLAVTMDGRCEIAAYVPQQPAGTGFLPDGRMLVASRQDRRILRRESDGTLVEHADLSHLARSLLNDMVVDDEGRAWVGDFGFDFLHGETIREAGIMCVEPDGTTSLAADGLHFPNGMVLTADRRTLIVAESFGNRLTAFDKAAGTLSNRRTWASFGDCPDTIDPVEALGALDVTPDGICLDAEGAVWLADATHRRLLRVAEGGRVLEQRETEVGVFACMLGGEDGRTLFVCATPDFRPSVAAEVHRSSIVMTRVDVPRAGLP